MSNTPPNQTKEAPNLSQMGLRHGNGIAREGVVKGRSKNPKETLLKIWSYLKRQRQGLTVVILCTALTSCLMLAGPYLIGKTIDHDVIPHHVHPLLVMCLVMLGIYVLGAVFTWIQQYVAAGLSQKTVQAMRLDLFKKYQDLPVSFFDQKTHGELMSRATNDIENVSNSLNQTVVQLVSSLFMLIGSVVMMFRLSLWMTLITLLTIPLITFITKKVTAYTRQFFSEQQKYLGNVNGYVQESMSGLRVIKVFGREEQSTEEFREMNERLRQVAIKAQSLSGSMGPMMNTMRNLSFVVIAVIGGFFAYDHMITIGIIVSFLNYSSQFSQPINQLANQYNMLQSAIAGAERVFDVMDLESEDLGQSVYQHPIKIKGEVVLDRVNFSYTPEVPILKNVSLHAKPGQMVALVGPTGAGKTTLINLLTRFYEIQSGHIFIDGQDLYKLDKAFIRQEIGLVLQDAYVFSGTIRENIRYGRLNATDEEVEQAAKLANADVFIRKLPNGYETLLNADGSNISQGQRQLLTIARAILANPAILILDEATSSVDTRTELHIQEAMRSLMKGRTSFVIAHRLSTIQEADQILVINNGEIVESGSHEELLKMSGFYAELYHHQVVGQQVG